MSMAPCTSKLIIDLAPIDTRSDAFNQMHVAGYKYGNNLVVVPILHEPEGFAAGVLALARH